MIATLLFSLLGMAGATHYYYEPECEFCVGLKCWIQGPYKRPDDHDINDKCEWLANEYDVYGPNGRAAVPQSAAENAKAFAACEYDAALGIADENNEGEWENMKTGEVIFTLDGGAQNGNYVNWDSGYPSDNHDRNIARYRSDGTWKHDRMLEERHFCCEFDRHRCLDTGVCFAAGPKVTPGEYPENILTPACQAEFGPEWEVAVPEDDDENEKAFFACGHSSFLGITDHVTEDTWRDLNKGHVISYGDDCEPGRYCNWLHGQPNGLEDHYAGPQHIAQFLYDDQEWNDIGIHAHEKVCCQRRPGSEQPTDAPTPEPTYEPTYEPTNEQTPVPTPGTGGIDISSPPTDMPTGDVCVGGLTNSDGTICCSETECTQCGGCACSKQDGGPDLCCPNTIIWNDIYCTFPEQRGCIISDPGIIVRDSTCPPIH